MLQHCGQNRSLSAMLIHSSTYSSHLHIQQIFTEHLRCSRHWGGAVNETDPRPCPLEHRSWKVSAGLSVPSSQGQVWFSGLMRTGQHSHAEKHPHSCVWLHWVPELPANDFSEPQATLTHHLSALLPSQLGRLFIFVFFFFLEIFFRPKISVYVVGAGGVSTPWWIRPYPAR